MHCGYCEFKCNLEGNRYGVCAMYMERNGKIAERFPNMWVTGVSRMESLPLYHIYPGGRALTLGTASCNFKCRYCSNSFIAKERPETAVDRLNAMSPERIIAEARKQKCGCIVFNINEPTVSLQSLQKLSLAAKASDMPMGCLTNAYFTEETGSVMTSIFSFFNAGLKGLSQDFCRSYLGIPSAEPVLRNIRFLAKKAHIEIVTPVIQGVNDGELDEMADFLLSIDREIPWHIFRLLPESDMKEEAYPNIDIINERLMSCRAKLPYIYFHNFVGSDWVDTLCPQCGDVVIERFSMGCGGDMLKRILCSGGICQSCGTHVRLIEQSVKLDEAAL